MRTLITAQEWTTIVNALHAKAKSPVTAGRDYESVEWRAHLREIIAAIRDGEQESLNEQDWAEVYYALCPWPLGDESEVASLLAKIGPDGRNMVTV